MTIVVESRPGTLYQVESESTPVLVYTYIPLVYKLSRL